MEKKEKVSGKEIMQIFSGDLNVGMAKVDPLDIRPPMILLVQKSSAVEDFVDQDGQTPKVGQFFHNGKMEILDSFECYFLFAAKGTYVNKRKPEEGERPQYKAIGAMADDLTLFAMNFRSSALYTLSGVFMVTKAMCRPMYSLRCLVEVKGLENEQGKWWIPVIRRIEPEKDAEKLKRLQKMARALDSKAERIVADDEEEKQDINVDDVPF
jgi:hypothetical protein